LEVSPISYQSKSIKTWREAASFPVILLGFQVRVVIKFLPYHVQGTPKECLSHPVKFVVGGGSQGFHLKLNGVKTIDTFRTERIIFEKSLESQSKMQPSKRPSALNKYQYRQQQHQQHQQQYQQQLPQQEQHQQHQNIRQEQNFRQRQQQNLPRQQHPPLHANPIDASVGRMTPVLAPTPVQRPSTNTATRKKVPPAAPDQRRLTLNAQQQQHRQVQARQFPTKNAMNLPVPSPRPGTALLSTQTNVASPPRLFDLFFDVPHPGASKESDRARMVEPPEASESSARFLSELYEPSAVSRLARFAFPFHDDHKYGTFTCISNRNMHCFVASWHTF
jgi:hypothetical protein